MRSVMARWIMASERSVQRFGTGVKPLAPEVRWTISRSIPRGSGVFEEVFAVAAVDPDFADRGMGCGCLVEESLACGVVLDAGRGDQDGQQEAAGVRFRRREGGFLVE